MRETEAQAVLLVKAFEEADVEGLLVPLDERRLAAEAARAASDDPETTAILRARRLLPVIEARAPGTGPLLRGTRLGAGATPWVLAGAFAVGLVSNALGPHRRIDVWQWPFVFLFAWNALWYVVFLVGPWLSRADDEDLAASTGTGRGRTGAGAAIRIAGRGARLARRLFDATVGRFTSRAQKRDARTATIAATAVGRFAAEWRRATAPLLASRARLLLHAGSLALATGLVVGMYARALTFRYDAAWESTILSAGALQRMVDALLGPAGALLGRGVPGVGPYMDPAHGDAAPWLHLYAVSTLLYVALPRTLFLLREGARARSLAASVPAELSLAYARRVGIASAGAGTRVAWRGYGYRPPPRAADALTSILHAAFGSQAEIEHADDVEYGADDPDAGRVPEGCTRVVVVSLAQTPEAEVHGAFLAARVARRDGTRVVADAAPLVARKTDATRIEERRRLWTRVGAEAGVEVIHADLSAPTDDAVVSRVGGKAAP